MVARLLAWLFPVRLPRCFFPVEQLSCEQHFDPFGSPVVNVTLKRPEERPTWILCKR
jgi:hypothetical protein